MAPAIRIENLGKKYRVSQGKARTGYRTLRESLVDAAAAPFRRLRSRISEPDRNEEFWALKDVSFEVQAGDVLGIIGRNGAGKSTLLKILSRITKPAAGRAVINGRVGSLLEVGTGFHPELTGRENVYLNGSILGMNKKEIDRRFDEIVAFAEVEQFLDTPVKRYSSGMYVRLAFAVAAHLEPEILIVDEVLAVGDAGFQKKCFQHMSSLRGSGRTVLVVSHNLGAIRNICTTAFNLERGQIISAGPVDRQIALYLNRLTEESRRCLSDRHDREGDGLVRVTAVEFENDHGQPIQQAICGEELRIRIRCRARHAGVPVDFVALSVWTEDGLKLFHVDNTQSASVIAKTGLQRDYTCCISRLPLPPGVYHVNVAVNHGGATRDHVYSATTLNVLAGDFYRVGRTASAGGGLVLVDSEWK